MKTQILVFILCTLAEEEPEIKWKKDGKKINAKKDKRVKIDWNIKDDTQFIQFKKSTMEDSGEYTVTVSNSAGEVKKTAKVVVEKPAPEEPEEEEEEEEESEEEEEKVVKPEFVKMPKGVSVMEGETILIKFLLKEG